MFVGSYSSKIMASYKHMVSGDICPDIYMECLERVVEGCCASEIEGFVQPAYWEVLRVLVNCAKSMSHYP